MAAILAGHGYVVAVPEIYHEFEPAGTVLAYDQAGADRGNAHKITKTIETYDADTRAVIAISSPAPTAPAASAPWESASAAISPFAPR